MNRSEEHPILVEVATTIADGLPVDWDSLIAAHPEIAEDLETLRVLQTMDATRRKVAAEREEK
jgi:hypothetical protein